MRPQADRIAEEAWVRRENEIALASAMAARLGMTLRELADYDRRSRGTNRTPPKKKRKKGGRK